MQGSNVPFRLVVTGGGSGGHTYPALAAVRSLRARLAAEGRELRVVWAGSAGGLESRVAADEDIPFRPIATGKLRRARNPLRMITMTNIRDMARVPAGFWQACGLLREFRPDAVLATGGYAAVPVGLAAWLLRYPLVVHEQTVRLGLANRLLARGATRMAVTSDSTVPLLPGRARASTVVTGNPVRPEVLGGHGEKAVAALGWAGWTPGLPVVYVTGGAQGSAQVNSLVTGILPWLLRGANVVHQCGAQSVDAMNAAAAGLPADLAGRYLVTGFIGSELPDLLALTDVLVSRSGAGTLTEITALGKASVLIPLASSAGNEQWRGARQLAESQAAVALLDETTPDALRAALAPLLDDPARRETIAANARALGRPRAAEALADVVLAAAAR
ncbi:MAG: UDP-N-acetylglucosamine--N-acetylmuramyl-(pentapeptide) pyrophosphoryl-undecaprenol N-acetylglucosamine transferase [Streptosporangiales bacterium]|nr:UDP-N-acetylglucosamine--N-acetylmuramyl-(pentapeptide) pyrophosphoryl-undecaprenol N-acetylglucosamine transferase [Streptosporangiales bacterium]